MPLQLLDFLLDREPLALEAAPVDSGASDADRVKDWHKWEDMEFAERQQVAAGLREAGETRGGPRPFTKKDRSRFSNSLESLVCQAK